MATDRIDSHYCGARFVARGLTDQQVGHLSACNLDLVTEALCRLEP
jgi:hypothetical protein